MLIRSGLFSLSLIAALEGTPKRYEQPPEERVNFFDQGCEILEKAPSFRRDSSLHHNFHKEIEERLDRCLSPFTDHSSPQRRTPSPSAARYYPHL